MLLQNDEVRRAPLDVYYTWYCSHTTFTVLK